ncbi:AsmA-like C-terminal region-containing protein [Acidisphaera sp. L21]|uniref:AsmA family protein n=1 Tax=Acidisphaera sp. L21 TaxID=1641851 RepID=UPI00131A9C62|nr:AsmA-like C-terminal region-containing protein [Acidisphaera sp. L21]
MIRWTAYIAGGLVAVIIVAAVAIFLLLDRYDFGRIAASRASAALNRSVTIAQLHVMPGRWSTIKMMGLQIDNLPGGTRAQMVTLHDLTAEVDVLSLLHGPVVLRHVEIDGLSILLERIHGDTRNWRFSDTPPKADKEDRSGFPTLLDVYVKASDITVRTTSGHLLQSRIDDGTLETASANAPVSLALKGAYHDAPLTVEAMLQPIVVLRDAATPYGTDIHITSGDTTLHFKGTMTKPLAIDGAAGMLTLHAPTLRPILTMAGAPADAFNAAVDLTGSLTRSDAVWALTEVSGHVDDSMLAPSMLRFVDGGHGHPDDVTLDLALQRLNLDRLLAGRGRRTGSDAPMRVEPEPDPQMRLHLNARQVSYAGNSASDVTIKAAVMPGRIALDELTASAFGAKLTAAGHAETADKSNRLFAEATVSGVDVQQLRRLTGGGAVPIAGRLDAQAFADGAGDSLDSAARAAHVAAVVWMTAGSISRDVVEKASLDIRRLFRKPEGMAPVSCMLGVVELRNGLGTLAPVRIRTADGTIAGQGSFDLRRNRIDVTIGSQSATTSAFALDVPVRISGDINNPDISPSTRSVVLTAADLSKLTPQLRPIVQRNLCAR